ncbi:MAG: alpha-2-macroglobulin family protein [Sinimarinibacterium flocculans]|uniref:alpha-2-macroglobulin family protein n=1 Tax=Sinimarinibacterium flocculans TaxID=985250 RepID=UPI003C3E205D
MAKVLALLAGLFAVAAHAADLRVTRITPAGDDVRGERQIVIAFDRAMVPLGRMQRGSDEVPARVAPDPGCRWRWLDPQLLACDLPDGDGLQPAMAYRVDVDAGTTALDGAVLRKAVAHAFVTERPRLLYAGVASWRAPTQPELQLRFNQPVTAASVVQALRFGGAVEVGPDLFDSTTPFYTPQGEARELWRLWPREPLPADRTVNLQVGAGLVSAQGTQPGQAQDNTTAFHTFPEPRWLGLSCQVGQAERRFAPGVAATGCSPLDGIELVFSAPVAVAALREHLAIEPSPPLPQDPDYDPWANAGDARPVAWRHAAGQVYRVRLPFAFSAESRYRLRLDANLTDRFERPLARGGEIELATGARRPALVFEHDNAVLEAGLDTEVPAVVTNLEAIVARYTRIDAQGRSGDLEHRVPVEPVRNLAFAMPIDVRGMVGRDSGAVRGELRTEPDTGHPRRFFAQLTPFQVHVKLGHANSLVWVTRLDDGQVVADAQVTILGGDEVLAQGTTDAQGIVLLAGSGRLDPQLDRAWESGEQALAVHVRRGDDFALLPLEHDFAVDTWRASREQVSAWRRARYGHLRVWGTTAQGVYRAGETIQYKVYVRDDAGARLAAAPEGEYRLVVYDPTGTAVHERSGQTLNAFGALDGEVVLAKSAAVGWYRFELRREDDERAVFEALRVLVADFVPAPFRVSAELRARAATPDQSVEAHVQARLHGGGPFSAAPLRALARLEAAPFSSAYKVARGFHFDSSAPDARDVLPLLDERSRLDGEGMWTTTLSAADGPVRYGRLLLEGSVEDDRGRSIAARASLPYHGRDRYIGLRYDGWVLKAGEPADLQTLVVDADGEPRSGAPTYVKVERKRTHGARVKGAGNAYITRYTHEWERIETCPGRSTDRPATCTFTPDAAGEYRVTAMVRDSRDRLHETRQWLYAQGRGAVLWEEPADYSLELDAERESWRVGDTARFLVHNPFPGATALITVERYGVIDRRVEVLETATPVIEIPVTPEFVPGAYVSVIVMSPRVDTPPTQGVDLGKPTFRMGYAPLVVDEPWRQIDVEVKADREQYRPRETVTLALQARPRQPTGEPVEFAVAVLDEAVFDLIRSGSDYFDPLKGLTALDPLDLANFSLLTRLVGRQKFEKKGANPGGDGGADLSLRSIERFVAYWNPSLPADADGGARVSFALPDQLTGWRVLALAVTPTDRMGLGQYVVPVSKPTELRPAMPNQLAVGDRFEAAFTVLNRADAQRRIEVAIRVDGGARGETTQRVALAPFERARVALPLTVESDASLRFEAQAGDGEDHDALVHVVPVRQRRMTAAAADLADLTVDAPLQRTLQVPADVLDASLQLQWSPTLLGSLGGVFGQMRDYPYTCWEQKLSRAVMAAHFSALSTRTDLAAEWPAAAALPKQVLDEAIGFQAPGGGMAYFVATDAYASPYLSAFTGLAFGWLQAAGHAPPADVWDRLDAYLLRLLREDPAASGYDSRPARAQLRAVVLAALAPRGKIDAAEVARHASRLPEMGLFGESLLLVAAQQVDGAEAPARAARERVLARANESAGGVSLQDGDSDAWTWLLGSPLRSNCAALSALVGERTRDGWQALPVKLVRHIEQARSVRTHWANTQENLFCTRALIDYVQAYETEPAALEVRAQLDGQAIGEASVQARSGASLRHALDAPSTHDLQITASGQGRAYQSTVLRYAEPADAPPVSAGLALTRRYAVQRDGRWQPLETSAGVPLRLQRGELLKVELDLQVPAWMSYVVVDDPVPGGIEPLNPDLATTAGLDVEALGADGAWPWPFYHRELRFDAVRHYAEALPQGHHRLVWVGQAVAAGEFAIDRPHAEQMYEPDVYANGTAARLFVEDAAP